MIAVVRLGILTLAFAACSTQATPEPARSTVPVDVEAKHTPTVAKAPVPAPATPAPAPAPEPAPPPKPTLVTHTAPEGLEEQCQLLVAFPFTPDDVKIDPQQFRWYREDDFEEIAELCSMNLYAPETTKDVTAVGICPKTHWSTPGLEVHAIDEVGMKKADFEKTRCRRDRRLRGAKKVAKFKTAVYWKEPQTALMYFHFSRLLGAAPIVPPVTFRTVSRKQLARWSSTAISTLGSKKELPRLNPLGGWVYLRQKLAKADELVPGSFSETARGEHYHKPFTYLNEKEHIRIGGIFAFRAKQYYKIVASSKPLVEMLAFDPEKPKQLNSAIQSLATAQDFTHLLILDHVFNQRDRSGNINSKVRYHYLDKDNNLRSKKKPDVADTVALDRLLLKDNDDGLRWDRHGMLNASLIIDEIRHVDSLTYARMQWLAKLMSDEATGQQVEDYFVDSVHISRDSYQEVRERFLDLAARFEKAHTAGKLALDLDLEPAFAARKTQTVAEGNK